MIATLAPGAKVPNRHCSREVPVQIALLAEIVPTLRKSGIVISTRGSNALDAPLVMVICGNASVPPTVAVAEGVAVAIARSVGVPTSHSECV